MSGQLGEDSYHREASQVLSECEGETPVKFQTVSILSVVCGVKVKYLLRTEILVQDYISSQARLIPAVSNQPVSPNRKKRSDHSFTVWHSVLLRSWHSLS